MAFVSLRLVHESNERVQAFHFVSVVYRAIVVDDNPFSYVFLEVKDMIKHAVYGSREQVKTFTAGHGEDHGSLRSEYDFSGWFVGT